MSKRLLLLALLLQCNFSVASIDAIQRETEQSNPCATQDSCDGGRRLGLFTCSYFKHKFQN